MKKNNPEPQEIIKEPIYQQLNKILRSLINSNRYSPGEKFLTERLISERYQVSRATANKALSSLVSEGLLEFKKGIGTFINTNHNQSATVSLKSFTKNAESIGKTPSTKVLQFEELEAGDIDIDIKKSLNLRKNEKLYYFRRLRLADNTPMILEQRYLKKKFFSKLKKEDLQGSLFNLIENRYGLIVTGVEEKVEAISLTTEESKLLKIDDGMASLLIISIGYIKDTVPLWWERTIHRPDGFELRCQVMTGNSEHSDQIPKIAFKGYSL